MGVRESVNWIMNKAHYDYFFALFMLILLCLLCDLFLLNYYQNLIWIHKLLWAALLHCLTVFIDIQTKIGGF